MGAGAINIPIGVTVTDLVSGFNLAGNTTRRFTSQFRADFEGLKNVGSIPAGSINSIASSLGLARKNVHPLLADLGSLRQTGQGLGALSNIFGGVFAVDKILGAGAAITGTTGKFEKFGGVLKNALQSQSGSKDSLSLLTDFAADTPNQLDELTGSYIKFVNRGLIPTREQLTNFGDLAASQGKGFDQLTEAILDAQSGEFERLKEFGVRASKSGDQVTLSFKGMTQTVSNTSDAITGAIQKFGQLSGVAGSMAAVSATLEGQESNLADTYDRLLVAIGNNGVAGGYRLALSAAQEFLTVVTDLIANSPAQELQNQKTELNGLVGAIALANDNETLRLSLIQKLKSEYPEFLGKLNDESATTDLLARRLAEVNTQYEQKIRIALGQEKIKQATDDLTKSIRQQQSALELLAKASGKPVTELEKLDAAQRVALAKQVASTKRGSEFQLSYFGQAKQIPTDYIAGALVSGLASQKKAQAELDKLTGENASRQADLTRQTVAANEVEIKQIREKIRLRQVNKQEGLDEIKRLSDLSLTAQGKTIPAAATPTLTNAKTRAVTAAGLDTGNMAIFKRYADQLKRDIESIGADSPLLRQKQEELAAINNSIERLQALTSSTQKVAIPGIQAIVDSNLSSNLRQALLSITQLSAITPSLFAKAGTKDFLTDIQRAAPSLDFVRAKIEEVRATITQLTLSNVKVPPELIAQLRDLKKLIADTANVTSSIEVNTDSGNADGKNDDKWTQRAQKRIDQMKAMGQQVNTTAQELGGQMKTAGLAFAQASFAALESIGTALGNGGNPLKAALQSITDALGNYLIKQGEALALAALFEQAAAVAAGPFAPLLSIPVGFQLAAAGVMITGGAALKSFGGSFAGGGLFTGESIIRVGENARAIRGGGEFVAPVALGADLISARIMKNLVPIPNPKLSQISKGLNERRSATVQVAGEFQLRDNVLVAAVENYYQKDAYYR